VILYKYLPPQRIDVLQRLLIRYTQPGALNDPFDSNPVIDPSLKPSEFLSDLVLRNVNSDIINKLRYSERFLEIRKCRNQCLSKNLNQFAIHRLENSDKATKALAAEIRDSIVREFDNNYGILSLSEIQDSPLMWSHYTEARKGFVIGFDCSHPYFDQRRSEDDDFLHLRKVNYRKERPDLSKSGISAEELFLVKSVDWEYEKEWRDTRPLADADEILEDSSYPIHLFSLPAISIKMVILGSRISSFCKSTLMSLLSSRDDLRHVSLYSCDIGANGYGMIVKKMSS